LQKVGVNITCQMMRENVQTNDTTPHVYGKEMLEDAVDSSMWIITIP
jgi:hypothetical protein